MPSDFSVAQLRAIQADHALTQARHALAAAQANYRAAETAFELRWTAGLDDDERDALNQAYQALEAAQNA